MKKLFFILFIFIAIQGVSQDYIELLKKYKDICDSIVYDTVIEKGIIEYDIKIIDEKIELIAVDTIWYEISCPEYKNSYRDYFIFNSDNIISNSLTENYINVGITSHSNPTISRFTTEIVREKYCSCKNRDFNFEEFNDWIIENYLKQR